MQLRRHVCAYALKSSFRCQRIVRDKNYMKLNLADNNNKQWPRFMTGIMTDKREWLLWQAKRRKEKEITFKNKYLFDLDILWGNLILYFFVFYFIVGSFWIVFGCFIKFTNKRFECINFSRYTLYYVRCRWNFFEYIELFLDCYWFGWALLLPFLKFD